VLIKLQVKSVNGPDSLVTKMSHNKLIFTALALLLLLQGGNLLHSLLIKYADAITRMSPLFKSGLYGMVFGSIYYFAALFDYFMQAPASEPGTVLIAGRPFQVSRSLTNPTNHVIASSLLLFASFALLLSAWVIN